MNIVLDVLQTYLPSKRKQTPSGWLAFNAPCCEHNGTTPDTRQRGGLIAKADESPRSFEVLGQLMNSLTTTTKELLLLQKTKNEIEKKDKSSVRTENNLFVGSTKELQELLEQKKK